MLDIKIVLTYECCHTTFDDFDFTWLTITMAEQQEQQTFLDLDEIFYANWNAKLNSDDTVIYRWFNSCAVNICRGDIALEFSTG